MNKKGTGRCRDPTGPEEKTINEKKGKDIKGMKLPRFV